MSSEKELEVVICLGYSRVQAIWIVKGTNERGAVYGLMKEGSDEVSRSLRKEAKK
jgi:hypothetical protein